MQPFASLVGFVDQNVPIVLINRENPGLHRENLLFLSGDLDANVENLMKDLGWDIPKIEKKVPKPADVLKDDEKIKKK